MHPAIRGISSMATRQLLADLVALYEHAGRGRVSIESVGGVDAARRVRGGEVFDFVVLASQAIGLLADAGRVSADSIGDVARSEVAVAVQAGAPRPDIPDESALRQAVRAARALG
jgi:molybdate transport system substrate-binding protein